MKTDANVSSRKSRKYVSQNVIIKYTICFGRASRLVRKSILLSHENKFWLIEVVAVTSSVIRAAILHRKRMGEVEAVKINIERRDEEYR